MDSKWLEGLKIISNKVKAPITISFPKWYIGSLKSIPINKSQLFFFPRKYQADPKIHAKDSN